MNTTDISNLKWRNIPGYGGRYMISDHGDVKSLPWLKKNTRGEYVTKEKMLSPSFDTAGYKQVRLYSNGKGKTIKVHKLVAITFLNHIPDGHNTEIDHINYNILDNRVENLQIISKRENLSKDKWRHNTKSKYVGVSASCCKDKWDAKIQISGKSVYLGVFDTEIDAKLAYDEALNAINAGLPIKKHYRQKTSRYRGVHFLSSYNRWVATIWENKKQIYIGRFTTEQEAYKAVCRAKKK